MHRLTLTGLPRAQLRKRRAPIVNLLMDLSLGSHRMHPDNARQMSTESCKHNYGYASFRLARSTHGAKTLKNSRYVALSLGFAISVFSGVSAQAQTTCQNIGNQRVCNDYRGNSSTTQQIGNMGVTNYSNGMSSTTQRIGNQNITNFSNGQSATSQRIGNQNITSFSNGTTATTQQIGNQTITTYSDGRTVTCQTIGNQRVCN